MSTLTQVIPVPQSGLGASVDVSAMVGQKTVILTGRFRGAYVLYGAHVGASLAPLFQFDAGGVEGMRLTLSGSLASVAIRSLASDASGVTASITGDSVPGNNTFATLGTLSPGDGGPQPAYDLGTSNYQSDLNFIMVGGLEGKLVVEGSSDGVAWNPIGQFSVDPSGPSLLGGSAAPELAPLGTEDLVRYVRLNVLGRVVGGGLVVTVGGSKSGGGGGAFETLAQTYQVGSSTADQTIVLADARGGNVIVDARTGGGFTGAYAIQVWSNDPLNPGSAALGAGFPSRGGLDLGPYDIVVGFATTGPTIPATTAAIGQQRIVIGNAVLNLDPTGPDQTQTVAIGSSIVVNTECRYSVIIGNSLAVGILGGDSTAGIVVGSFSSTSSFDAVLVGVSSVIGGVGGNNVSLGNNHLLNNGALPQSVGGVCLVAGGNVSLDGNQSQGVGAYLTVVGDFSFAGGSGSSAYGDRNVMLSTVDGAGFGGSIGTALVSVDLAVLVGGGGHVYGDRGIAIGSQAVAGIGDLNGISNLAIGDGAVANTDILGGYGTLSVGAKARGYGAGDVVVGRDSTVFGNLNVVVGPANSLGTAAVDYTYNVVCGYQSILWGDDSVSIGRQHTVGTGVATPTTRAITIGSIISVGAGADYTIAIGTDISVSGGIENIVIGTSVGASAAVVGGIAFGAHASVSNSYSQAYGRSAQTLADNQVVFGQSGGVTPGLYAVHEFVVRGYNGAPFNTLDAVDNPVDSGNVLLGVTGLSVVYIQNSVLSQKTLKAALLANLPVGALVAYLE